jgi:hypothetical protein
MAREIEFEDYIILSNDSQSQLYKDVAKFFKIGWICQGGVCVFDTPSSVRYYQAMVKPCETNKEIKSGFIPAP